MKLSELVKSLESAGYSLTKDRHRSPDVSLSLTVDSYGNIKRITELNIKDIE